MSVGSTLRHEMIARDPPGARAARPRFADAARENLDAVYRYLTHMVGDPHLAEDLASATFERALRDWRRYDPARAQVSTWLIGIARRVALDHFRSEGRRRARERRYAAAEPQEAQAPSGPHGVEGELRAALAGLTRAERELVALRVVLDMDTAEAARIAGISPAAARAGLHRAMAKLRREVTRT